MTEFRYIPSDEVAQRHRARNTETPSRQPRRPIHKNVEQILSLGDVRYIMYRTRAYRVPPVPFKLGERVLQSHTQLIAYAKEIAMTGRKETADKFYRQMMIQARLLWQHMRPTGKIKRILWRLGLMHNPFRDASEQEITELTNFFLQCRMMSSVQPMVGKTEVS